MIKKDYDIIINIFNKYKFSYEILLKQVEAVENKNIIWSNSYLELYPYQNALDQLQKPKIYKKEPKSNEGIIVNWLKNNEPFFSFHSEDMNWGTLFMIDEAEKKIWLKFLANDDDIMVLDQIYLVVYSGSIIEKVLYYSKDDDMDEETFVVDRYLYIDKVIDTISREGFFENKLNGLTSRTFRFIYENKVVFIYSKDQTGDEELIYKGKSYI